MTSPPEKKRRSRTQWSLYGMLLFVTGACLLLGVTRNFPSFSSTVWQSVLIVGGWLLGALALMSLLLIVQAPLFFLIRWRLEKRNRDSSSEGS